MVLTFSEKEAIQHILGEYLEHPLVQEMKEYIQHGTVTTYDHCCNVVRVCMWMNRRFKLKADERELLIGALLHDFYLYDWHIKEGRTGLHGYTHPEAALKNAKQYFFLSEKQEQIILSHMWPLTLTKLPKCREALIVCLADKYCSTLETIAQRKESYKICG